MVALLHDNVAAAPAPAPAAPAAPTLDEIIAFAKDEAEAHLLPRFGSLYDVRRFAFVSSAEGRLVVSAAVEPEAIALAEHVASALRTRFGLEPRFHEDRRALAVYDTDRRVFCNGTSVPARRFALHLDVSAAT